MEFSIERNRRSLVCSKSLDVSPTSLNGKKLKKPRTYKTYKAIMVGYVDNHTRNTYKLYIIDTKRVIMTRDVKWDDWKINDSAETPKIFCDAHKEYLVIGIE